MMEPDWTGALCAQTDPEVFFPEMGGGGAEPARAVCQRCLHQAACLDYALDNDIRTGVWGGLSARERRAITRDRRGAAA